MPVRKVTTTNAALLELSQGIAIIDVGYQVTVEGKNVSRGYDLKAAPLYALARAGIVIKPLIDAWKKANGQIFEKNDPKPLTLENGKEERQVPAEKRAAYDAAVRELLAQPVEVELPELKVVDLKVGSGKGENPIPPSALTMLNPMLVWPEDEG